MDESTFPVAGAKKKKRGLVFVVGGALALIGGYFVFFYKDKDGNTLWNKWTGRVEEEGEIPAVEKPSEAPPAGTTWRPESFPLAKGMYGGHIKLLQKKLGISADGKFGSGTEKAVKAKFGKTIVEITDYNNFVSPPPAIKKGDTAYARSSPTIMYAEPSTSGKKGSTTTKKLGVVIDITKGTFPFAKIYNATLEANIGSGYFYVPVKNITNKA